MKDTLPEIPENKRKERTLSKLIHELQIAAYRDANVLTPDYEVVCLAMTKNVEWEYQECLDFTVDNANKRVIFKMYNKELMDAYKKKCPCKSKKVEKEKEDE